MLYSKVIAIPGMTKVINDMNTLIYSRNDV